MGSGGQFEVKMPSLRPLFEVIPPERGRPALECSLRVGDPAGGVGTSMKFQATESYTGSGAQFEVKMPSLQPSFEVVPRSEGMTNRHAPKVRVRALGGA